MLPFRRVLRPEDFRVWIPDELFDAVLVDAGRIYRRRLDTPELRNRPRRERWNDEIEGHLAECGYTLFRGRVWVPNAGPDKATGDVLGDEVRQTTPGGHLIVQVDDIATRRCVLMVGALQSWRVAGWYIAGDAQVVRYLREPFDGKKPAGVRYRSYWVPESDLRDPAELLR